MDGPMPETAEPSLPKLRTDLVIRQQEAKDGPPVFVFKDPLRQRFYRFREMEHFIALQLNGLTSFDSIRKRVEERSGAQLTAAVLERFVQTLHGLNLLESDASESPKGEARRRVQGGLLYLR